MHSLRAFATFLLLKNSHAQFTSFDSILSVHTYETPYCPKRFTPDPSYIGCCGYFQTIAYAAGPDGVQSPGCCRESNACTGAPPIQYDWKFNDYGG